MLWNRSIPSSSTSSRRSSPPDGGHDMERECCLSMLIVLMGGTGLLASGWWPAGPVRAASALHLEEITWRRVWLPVIPALVIAVWLCGWALAEPDPVPESVPISVIFTAAPFALIVARAVVRAGWSLVANYGDPATATVGLLRPWIVFSPHLARRLNEEQINAVLEHERAHARHWDPLRIWLAQLLADLQWPWPQSHERLRQWLLALELARDEEARATGVEGTDLAEAILASTRFDQRMNLPLQPALTGEPAALKQRIGRLLDSLPVSQGHQVRSRTLLLTLLPTLLVAMALGLIFGERAVRTLFWIAA